MRFSPRINGLTKRSGFSRDGCQFEGIDLPGMVSGVLPQTCVPHISKQGVVGSWLAKLGTPSSLSVEARLVLKVGGDFRHFSGRNSRVVGFKGCEFQLVSLGEGFEVLFREWWLSGPHLRSQRYGHRRRIIAVHAGGVLQYKWEVFPVFKAQKPRRHSNTNGREIRGARQYFT